VRFHVRIDGQSVPAGVLEVAYYQACQASLLRPLPREVSRIDDIATSQQNCEPVAQFLPLRALR
jgi:hypothetical protein